MRRSIYLVPGGGGTVDNLADYRAAVLADSPAFLIEGHDGLDSSGNGRDATKAQSPVAGADLLFAPTLDTLWLNGLNEHLLVPYQLSGSDFTFECWAMWNTNCDRARFFSTGAISMGTGRSPLDQGPVGSVWIGNDDANIWVGRYSTATYNDGAWHHLVGVWDGTDGVACAPAQFTVYVDGAAVAVTDHTYAAQTAPLTGDTDTKVGINYNLTQYRLGGILALCAGYPSVLSAARVQAHYDAAMAGVS